MKRTTLLHSICTATLTILIATTISAAERMRPGQWEITITEGTASKRTTHCASAEEVKAINGTEAQVRADIEASSAKLDCIVQNFTMEGDRISYITACRNSATQSTTVYHGNSFEVDMTAKSATETRTRHVSARRLGACKR